MSQILKLDALVTVLACLTTTQDSLPPIKHNSLGNWKPGNETGSCPVSTLSVFTARMQHLAEEVNNIKVDIGLLREQLSDLARAKSNGDPRPSRHSMSSRMNAVSVQETLPRNCVGQKHGPVRIQPTSDADAFFVFCDQNIHGGGWLLIANRYDGSVDFHRTWQDYKSGFGELAAENFIGLDKLHLITNSDNYELIVIMKKQMGHQLEERFARYDQFSIGSEREKYLLYVLGSYAGDAGDSLRYHAGKKFTTYDQDNDDNAQNCARVHAGAWWYGRECFHSNLFGTFQGKFAAEIGNYKGILWKTFLDGPNGSLRRVRMLIRPRGSSNA